MVRCPACGEENPERARFCWSCGAALAAAAVPDRETRKTVTVLFADVTGSTGLGERLDPETLRGVMGRYFDAARTALERHGGTVEKFIGDAVMAVFGIPVLHEDDALRAVRGAVDLREAIDGLNDALERELGIRLGVRIGVNTGQVVAGDRAAGQTLVTGDAVTVAARLEQVAESRQVLIGEATQRLVRDAADLEPVEPLVLRGKTLPVAAWSVTRVVEAPEAISRRLDTPLVGRDRERRVLREAFERVADERTCLLLTVLGAPGVGKSRLIHDFVTRARAHATVLRGRCPAYGEGLSFRPVAEMLAQAAEVELDDAARARLAIDALAAAPQADKVVGPILGALGLEVTAAPMDETYAAFASLFESMSAERPLVLVLDDIQWAEPVLLDLIDHLADWSRDVPLLLLCIARPELLDTRPTWGGGKTNATTVTLEPLPGSASEQLIRNVMGGTSLPADVTRQLVETAEGNPLFLEELVATLVESGELRHDDAGWRWRGDHALAVPPSIQALLAARLDRLARAERDVIDGAAVCGKVFAVSAVTALLAGGTDRGAVEDALRTLVRRELLRAEPSDGSDRRFRFRHLLVRAAAYEGLSKRLRAELHERLATWLADQDAHGRSAVEETEGYHLEQAFRYRAELGPVDDHARDLATRGVERLVAAAEAAHAVYAYPEAARHWERAAAILAAVPEAGAVLAVDRAEILRRAADDANAVGDHARAVAIVDRAIEAVDPDADPVRAGLLRERRGRYRWELSDLGSLDDYRAALDLIPDEPPSVARARVMATMGQVLMLAARYAEARGACERAIEYARRVGARAEEAHAMNSLGVTVSAMGENERGVALLERSLEIVLDADAPDEYRARTYVNLAEALIDGGRLREALATYEAGIEYTTERKLAHFTAYHRAGYAVTLHMLGHWDEAEANVREVLTGQLSGVDLWNPLVDLAGFRSRRGAFDEAGELVRRAREETGESVDPQYVGGISSVETELACLAGRPRDALDVIRWAMTTMAELDDPDFLLPLAWALRAAADDPDSVDPDEVARMHTLARRIARSAAAPSSPLSRAVAMATLVEGEAACALGRPDPEPWRRGIGSFDAQGDVYLAAYARLRLAEALIARGAAPEEVRLELDAAAEVAARLGAVPLAGLIDRVRGGVVAEAPSGH